jgi:hypothetical protein
MHVTDIAPLKGLLLDAIRCNFECERGEAIVRSVPTLKAINGRPAGEFLKEMGKAAQSTIGAK